MIQVEIDFADVLKKINRAKDKSRIKRAVAKALAKIALELRSDVIPKTPRGTGELMNSWRVEKGVDNDITVGFDIIYAAYQERGMRADGSRRIQNRPAGGETKFLQNAIDENLQKYFMMYEEIILTELFK